ncbi:MAG: hypothetical protein LLG37_08870, partial [Spirochaetia bacterium]|nr:hypothetical protein [Spirochaetia bacterium]
WAAWNRMLPQFYECVFNYNFAYMKMRTEPLKTVLNGSYYFTILYLLPVISMAWFMVKSFLPKREDLPFLTVIAAIGSYAGVAALKGYYPHYFLTLIPYAALLGALFVRDIYAMLDGVLRLKYYAAAVVSLLLVLNAASYFVHSGTLQFVKSGRYSMDIFYQTRAISAAAKMALANSKGGKMFVFQNQPEVYFLAGGKAVSRYIYAYPLAIYGQAAAESFSREFIDGKPDVLVLEKGNYTAYETYVDNYYRKISETRNFEVFEKL